MYHLSLSLCRQMTQKIFHRFPRKSFTQINNITSKRDINYLSVLNRNLSFNENPINFVTVRYYSKKDDDGKGDDGKDVKGIDPQIYPDFIKRSADKKAAKTSNSDNSKQSNKSDVSEGSAKSTSSFDIYNDDERKSKDNDDYDFETGKPHRSHRATRSNRSKRLNRSKNSAGGSASSGGDDGDNNKPNKKDSEYWSDEDYENEYSDFSDDENLPATDTVPDVWKDVPLIAVRRHPVFPKFMKVIEVETKKNISNLMK